MVNAQIWLDQNYPKSERHTITNLDLKGKNLEGELTIKDFPNLERVECRNNKDLKSIKLINLPKLNYFHGNNCHLTEMVINNCPQINFLNVANNYLVDTKFLNDLNPEKLVELSLHTNDFAEQGLELFSKFVNLKRLFLDNCSEERFKKNEYNKFTGSLKPLQSLNNLELLSIGNTNIDSGLEFLPESLRKIGLNTSWWEIDTNCSRLRQELEEVSRVKGVTEKLKHHEEDDPAWFDDYYRIAPWRQARELLGEEGLKDITQPNAQKWFDKNYPKNEREEVTFLNINGKNLEGELDLNDFINLEKLDCSFNQLTSLSLGNCEKLTHLNCSWNKFVNTDFLKTIPHKEKLKVLRINNNERIKESLEWVKDFTGLTTLSLENSPFYGSLEPLKKMDELKRIYIGHTHISEGLEYLPESCKEVYCDTSDYKYKSIRIAKELSKFIEGSYYDIWKWREDKENDTSSKVIPLERLYVIRGNVKKFVNKWGKEAEESWYERFVANLKAEESEKNEVGNLQSPKEFGIYRYTKSAKWVARAGAVSGGVLALTDNSAIGGAFATVFPFVEILASNAEEELYAAKQKKWDEFINDAENLLDNYHELLGILEQVKKSDLGIVNQALNNLRDKVNLFLDTYDKPGEDGQKNGIIDISELTSQEARKGLADDLIKEDKEKGGGSQLGDIVLAMKKLEEEVIAYRQGTVLDRKQTEKEDDKQGEKETSESLQIKDEQEQYQAQIEIPLE